MPEPCFEVVPLLNLNRAIWVSDVSCARRQSKHQPGIPGQAAEEIPSFLCRGVGRFLEGDEVSLGDSLVDLGGCGWGFRSLQGWRDLFGVLSLGSTWICQDG